MMVVSGALAVDNVVIAEEAIVVIDTSVVGETKRI